MVIEYYLSIMWGIDFRTGYILILLNVRVYVDHFTVSLIAKQEPRLSTA